MTDLKIVNGVLTEYHGDGENVVVPEGVTEIAPRAFFNLTVSKITLPQSLKKIGDEAFKSCRDFKEITIPSGVKSIGKAAFMFCFALKKITLSEGLKSIDDDAFSCCFQLKEVAVPNSVTRIGSKAFHGCPTLSSLTVGTGVTEIGTYAFSACGGLRAISFPPDVRSIGDFAFLNCKALGRVDLPRGVEKFEDSALQIIWNAFIGSRLNLTIAVSMLGQYLPLVKENKTLTEQIKPLKSAIAEKALADCNVALLSALLSVYGADIDELDLLLEKSQKNIEITAFLLDYKNRFYTAEEIEEYENKRIENELSSDGQND